MNNYDQWPYAGRVEGAGSRIRYGRSFGSLAEAEAFAEGLKAQGIDAWAFQDTFPSGLQGVPHVHWFVPFNPGQTKKEGI